MTVSGSEVSVHQGSSQSNSVISKCHDSVDIDDNAPVTKKLKLEDGKSETNFYSNLCTYALITKYTMAN